MEYCQPGHTTNFSFDESRHFSGYASQYFKEINGLDARMLLTVNK